MTREDTKAFGKNRRRLAAFAALLFVCGALSAQAQQNAPAPPVSIPAPARNYEPGMLDSIGRWFKDSFSYLGSGARNATDAAKSAATGAADAAKGATDAATGAARVTADAAKDAAGAAKGAAGAVARLSGTRVVEGRERCSVAANGAPDCQRAAEAVCRTSGFATGSSLNIQSSKDCPPEVWLSRRRQDAGECKVQSYVTRAACQ